MCCSCGGGKSAYDPVPDFLDSFTDSNSGNQIIEVKNSAPVEVYDVAVTVQYTLYPEVRTTKQFQISVVNTCTDDSLIIDELAPALNHRTISYGDANPITWDDSLVSSQLGI